MKKVFYNKLVRDLIKDKIESKGEACAIRVIIDDAEFEQELLKKVVEEAGALAHVRSRSEFLTEYADLMVVLDALTQKLEISEAEILVAMTENVTKKGLFKNRHFLEWSEDVEKEPYKSNETPQGLK
jgi:predicted house-cleaning noncanonical NTP pyrophosphatase (MazG superfamily)